MYDKVLVTNGKNWEIGNLYFRRGRGIEYQEFKYKDSWIANGYQIDPELPLCEGIHRASSFEFGCFSDASPDSWGRALIKRYFNKFYKKNILFNSEYLLSVNDNFRIGDFRFYDDNKNLITNLNNSIPAEKDLQTFQFLITKFQKGEQIIDLDFLDIINYGSSLGGARPKLSIIDKNSSLWLAKFSSVLRF